MLKYLRIVNLWLISNWYDFEWQDGEFCWSYFLQLYARLISEPWLRENQVQCRGIRAKAHSVTLRLCQVLKCQNKFMKLKTFFYRLHAQNQMSWKEYEYYTPTKNYHVLCSISQFSTPFWKIMHLTVKCPKNAKKHYSVGQVVLELLIRTIYLLFWPIPLKLIGLMKF